MNVISVKINNDEITSSDVFTIHRCVGILLNHIRNLIGAKTDISYHNHEIIKRVLTIVTEQKLNEVSYDQVMINAITQVCNLFKSLSIGDIPSFVVNSILYLYRMFGGKFDFVVSAYQSNDRVTPIKTYKTEVVSFNDKLYDDLIKSVEVIYHPFGDGYIINTVDTKRSNCMLILDISRPYQDIDLGPQVLHLYEHLVCNDLFELPADDFIERNAFTSTVVQSCVGFYARYQDVKYTYELINRVIKQMIKNRSYDYWKSYRKTILMEYNRVMSEMSTSEPVSIYTVPSLDEHLLKVFYYWSNIPLRFHIITPSKIDFKRLVTPPISIKIERPHDLMYDIDAHMLFNYQQRIRYEDVFTMSITKDKYDEIIKFIELYPNVFVGIDNILCKRKSQDKNSNDEKNDKLKYVVDDMSYSYKSLIFLGRLIMNRQSNDFTVLKNVIESYYKAYHASYGSITNILR